ncbi:MAG: hypothetical protein ABSF26_24205 [Thermoguttaceae bacterium]
MAQLDCPEILAKLETLDDAVFEAIDGQDESLHRLRDLWPALLAELGEDLLAESRQQYLHYALSIWGDHPDAAFLGDPIRAVRAVEVLCLLFHEL